MFRPRANQHHCLLALIIAIAPACASKSKPPPAGPEPTPAPAPVAEPVAVEEPPPAEPAGPDNSALIAALDALSVEIEGCHGKLGTKQAGECSTAISTAIAALGDPIKNSTVAAELAGSQQELQTLAEKLAKAVDGSKPAHKEQHKHLDEIARLSKEMRAKL